MIALYFSILRKLNIPCIHSWLQKLRIKLTQIARHQNSRMKHLGMRFCRQDKKLPPLKTQLEPLFSGTTTQLKYFLNNLWIIPNDFVLCNEYNSEIYGKIQRQIYYIEGVLQRFTDVDFKYLKIFLCRFEYIHTQTYKKRTRP